MNTPKPTGASSAPGSASAHVDTFARDRMPAPEHCPEFLFELPELAFPAQLNCADRLLDDALAEGHGDRPALHTEAGATSYRQLLGLANRIANVLCTDLGVAPGNRVLLRAPNGLLLAASWLAVMKAGAIAVTTMPLLRARELTVIVERAEVDFAICDARLRADLDEVRLATGRLRQLVTYGDGDLEGRMARSTGQFTNVRTSSDDVCVLAFTSGTTGQPKATMHFHRDVIAMAEVVARHLLQTQPHDVYVGSPPLGFTFGLGALLVFPLYFRASAVLLESPTADALLAAVQRHHATCLFTAPTMYRVLLPLVSRSACASLSRCVSAGEPLPKVTSDQWHAATGLRIIDGIGATEMIHIFISAAGDEIRPGATGRPLPGYRACILDDEGRVLPRGSSGRLAVKGPTGCRYLDDERQTAYVVDGWNVTGDLYRVDEDGYFWFLSRADDLIVSAGYNIAGPEVESALMLHPSVSECAVVGQADVERGQIVKAYVVLKGTHVRSEGLVLELQEHVKATIAPYKYPRQIEFVDALPKTPTGKLQRFALRQQAAHGHALGG